MPYEAAPAPGSAPPPADRPRLDEQTRLERLEEARCIDCDYSLRGLTKDVCPECGGAFDADVFGTFRHPRLWPPWWVKYRDPPAWWLTLLLAAFSLLLLLDSSTPGEDLPFGLCIHALAFVVLVPWVVISWLCRAQARVEARRVNPDVLVGRPRRGGVWILIPVCLVLIASSLLTSWPLRLRFELSRAALNRAADNYTPTAPNQFLTVRRPSWIGLFRVESVSLPEAGVHFFETGSKFMFDGAGFIRVDPAEPELQKGDSLPASDLSVEQVLGGGWYVGRLHF